MKRVIHGLLAVLLTMTPLVQAVEDEGNLEALRRQAVAGDTAAQYEMGVLYEFGFHLADNLAHALAWYTVAADNGNERAARRRDLLDGQLSPAQREQARRLRGELGAAPKTADTPPAATPAAPAHPEKPAVTP